MGQVMRTRLSAGTLSDGRGSEIGSEIGKEIEMGCDYGLA